MVLAEITFKLELDSEPNLSRKLILSPTFPRRPARPPPCSSAAAMRTGLANAAGNVGIVPDTVTEGGWVLNTTSVTTVLPQIEAYCLFLTLPAEASVIISVSTIPPSVRRTVTASPLKL